MSSFANRDEDNDEEDDDEEEEEDFAEAGTGTESFLLCVTHGFIPLLCQR